MHGHTRQLAPAAPGHHTCCINCAPNGELIVPSTSPADRLLTQPEFDLARSLQFLFLSPPSSEEILDRLKSGRPNCSMVQIYMLIMRFL